MENLDHSTNTKEITDTQADQSLTPEDKEPSIEERFASLDHIIERMDADDVPLEEAFSLYQSGLAQVKAANEMLDSMEKALLMMNESGDLEDFE